MKLTRRKLKELLSEAVSGGVSGRPNYHSFVGPDGELRVVDEPGYDIDSYDVEQLASYHALNGDVDATLYRDNPDYRDAFIDMIVMKFGEERMQQFQGEEEEKEERRLLMDPDFDDPTEDDDLDDMGQVPFSEDYQNMIDDIESGRGRPYDIDESRYRVPVSNPGRSSREEMEIGDYGSDNPYYTSGPFEDEVPVLSREEQKEKKRREIERMRAEAEARRNYRAIMGDYGDVFDY